MPVKDLNPVSRGSFFDDPFFRDSWEDFDVAMQRVVGRYDPPQDRFRGCDDSREAYRQIRQENKNQDLYSSQAVQVTEKDGKFQAVIDVKDFNPRDLQVKVIDDRIVLEGRYDVVSPDGKSSTSKAFYREFALPSEADIDQVATALSKDGVLTIKAPRKEGTFPVSVATKKDFRPDHVRNIQNYIQNAQQSEAADAAYDSLPKDVKDRLLVCDKDSGRSSGSGSPSCVSPSPSDASSGTSHVSSAMEYGSSRRAPYNRPETAFKMKPQDLTHSASEASTVTVGSGVPHPAYGVPLGSTSSISSLDSSSTLHEDIRSTPTPSQTPQPTPSWPPITQSNLNTSFSPTPPNTAYSAGSHKPGGSGRYYNPVEKAGMGQPLSSNLQRPLARSSGGTATITVKEEDGKRIQTSETSSVVQEKDGFLESKEVSSEFSSADRGEGASRQAQTRMMREEVDPSGRGKKSEAADAVDVSESIVERRPDGSVVKTKKSSSTSSNFKQSFSTDPSFDSGFGDDIRSLMGRDHKLPQMPEYPFADMKTTFPSRLESAFPPRMMDMSKFPDFPDIDSAFSNRPMFPRSNFPDMGFSNFSTDFPSQNFSDHFNRESTKEEEQEGPHGTSKTKTFTQSSGKSSFSSNFGGGRF